MTDPATKRRRFTPGVVRLVCFDGSNCEVPAELTDSGLLAVHQSRALPGKRNVTHVRTGAAIAFGAYPAVAREVARRIEAQIGSDDRLARAMRSRSTKRAAASLRRLGVSEWVRNAAVWRAAKVVPPLELRP